MKWIDYREKLGIGFNDNDKFKMLKNQVINFIDILCKQNLISVSEYRDYCLMIGEYCKVTFPLSTGFEYSFSNSKNLKVLLSKYVALCHIYSNQIDYDIKKYQQKDLINFIEVSLDKLNISYEIITDEDGIFIFPKGAEELDLALITQPLEWLKDYPKTRDLFIKALKDYSECTQDNISNVADNFRKSLECFFQEFFKGGRSLENYKSDYGTYLKSKGVPAEISNNFQTLLEAYTNFNDNYAKHHDKTKLNVLEYLLYQTGNIMRLLITLNKE